MDDQERERSARALQIMLLLALSTVMAIEVLYSLSASMPLALLQIASALLVLVVILTIRPLFDRASYREYRLRATILAQTARAKVAATLNLVHTAIVDVLTSAQRRLQHLSLSGEGTIVLPPIRLDRMHNLLAQILARRLLAPLVTSVRRMTVLRHVSTPFKIKRRKQ